MTSSEVSDTSEFADARNEDHLKENRSQNLVSDEAEVKRNIGNEGSDFFPGQDCVDQVPIHTTSREVCVDEVDNKSYDALSNTSVQLPTTTRADGRNGREEISETEKTRHDDISSRILLDTHDGDDELNEIKEHANVTSASNIRSCGTERGEVVLEQEDELLVHNACKIQANARLDCGDSLDDNVTTEVDSASMIRASKSEDCKEPPLGEESLPVNVSAETCQERCASTRNRTVDEHELQGNEATTIIESSGSESGDGLSGDQENGHLDASELLRHAAATRIDASGSEGEEELQDNSEFKPGYTSERVRHAAAIAIQTTFRGSRCRRSKREEKLLFTKLREHENGDFKRSELDSSSLLVGQDASVPTYISDSDSDEFVQLSDSEASDVTPHSLHAHTDETTRQAASTSEASGRVPGGCLIDAKTAVASSGNKGELAAKQTKNSTLSEGGTIAARSQGRPNRAVASSAKPSVTASPAKQRQPRRASAVCAPLVQSTKATVMGPLGRRSSYQQDGFDRPVSSGRQRPPCSVDKSTTQAGLGQKETTTIKRGKGGHEAKSASGISRDDCLSIGKGGGKARGGGRVCGEVLAVRSASQGAVAAVGASAPSVGGAAERKTSPPRALSPPRHVAPRRLSGAVCEAKLRGDPAHDDVVPSRVLTPKRRVNNPKVAAGDELLLADGSFASPGATVSQPSTAVGVEAPRHGRLGQVAQAVGTSDRRLLDPQCRGTSPMARGSSPLQRSASIPCGHSGSGDAPVALARRGFSPPPRQVTSGSRGNPPPSRRNKEGELSSHSVMVGSSADGANHRRASGADLGCHVATDASRAVRCPYRDEVEAAAGARILAKKAEVDSPFSDEFEDLADGGSARHEGQGVHGHDSPWSVMDCGPSPGGRRDTGNCAWVPGSPPPAPPPATPPMPPPRCLIEGSGDARAISGLPRCDDGTNWGGGAAAWSHSRAFASGDDLVDALPGTGFSSAEAPATKRLVEHLRQVRGSSMRGWRLDLDRLGVGWVSRGGFATACRTLGFGAETKQFWQALRPDGSSAALRFHELDEVEADNLERFVEVLCSREAGCGDLDKAWALLDPRHRSTVSCQEFVRGVRGLGFTGNAAMLFKGLDTRGQGQVSRRDFDSVRVLSPTFMQMYSVAPSVADLRTWVRQELRGGVDELIFKLGFNTPSTATAQSGESLSDIPCSESVGSSGNGGSSYRGTGTTASGGDVSYEEPSLVVGDICARLKALGFAGDALSAAVIVAKTGDGTGTRVSADTLRAVLEGSKASRQSCPRAASGVGKGGSAKVDRKVNDVGMSVGRRSSEGGSVSVSRSEWDNSLGSSTTYNSERPSCQRIYFSVPDRGAAAKEASVLAAAPGTSSAASRRKPRGLGENKNLTEAAVTSQPASWNSTRGSNRPGKEDACSNRVRPGELEH
eukprot:TRINITY_DN41043_c0_g2_i1.p1 TRINITY_DN41043_c0_g2~~TRINITY_DN41043_c0_g2_i1.p1  ORF type:complete len:1417 (+),score=227.19 TRINITY_DN41043_c0_g2_i1:78-4328(+)